MTLGSGIFGVLDHQRADYERMMAQGQAAQLAGVQRGINPPIFIGEPQRCHPLPSHGGADCAKEEKKPNKLLLLI